MSENEATSPARQPPAPVSFRLPGDLVTALKQRAEENGESVSDLLRRGALMVLGICPTCGHKAVPDA